MTSPQSLILEHAHAFRTIPANATRSTLRELHAMHCLRRSTDRAGHLAEAARVRKLMMKTKEIA